MRAENASLRVGAKHVKIAISETAISLVELSEGCSLIRFQLGDGALLHGPGLGSGAELSFLRESVGRERDGCHRDQTDYECPKHWLPPWVCLRGANRRLCAQLGQRRVTASAYLPTVYSMSVWLSLKPV